MICSFGFMTRLGSSHLYRSVQAKLATLWKGYETNEAPLLLTDHTNFLIKSYKAYVDAHPHASLITYRTVKNTLEVGLASRK